MSISAQFFPKTATAALPSAFALRRTALLLDIMISTVTKNSENSEVVFLD